MERYGSACPVQNERVRRKAVKTNLRKYGAEYPMQSKEYRDSIGYESPFNDDRIKEKIKNTMLDRYGSECSLRNEQVRERARKTNLARYGSEYGFGSKIVQDKIKQTNIERYGVENVFQRQDVMDRIRQKNIDEYGVAANISRPDVMRKRHETMIERYGVDNPALNSELHDKAVRNRLNSSYDRFVERWKDYVVPMFSKEEYAGFAGRSHGTVYKWKCVKCGNMFEQHIHETGNVFLYMPRCWRCYPNMNEQGQSYKEKEVFEFVKSIYDGEIISNAHGIIGRRELDIYLPERNLAIEFDGFYWHSEQKGKDASYHLGKTEDCIANGIRLVHIFEDEWMNYRPIVEDRIRSLLGVGQKRIFARKCIVKEIDSGTANCFLDANHLQGGDNSPIRYGLFHEDELVSVMTFGRPRFNKNYDWELIRYASKLGVQVVGGASRLLKCFRDSHGGSMISYADRRYSSGKLYESIGFAKVNESKPNYWYVRDNLKLSRYQCQKHRLSKLLGEYFNPEWSEYENMMFSGFNKIYDCGNLVYALR